MEVEKIYRDESITLQSLAEELSIPHHQLSQLLNEKLNKSFSDFINTFRVEEAKKLLRDPKWADRKIISIAFEVGYNTKAAFYNVFKKYTNMTPSSNLSLRRMMRSKKESNIIIFY
jgi:YesN/AraC family two-component response regulator